MRKILCAFIALFMLVGCHKAKESVQEQTSSEAASMDSFNDSYYKIVNVDSDNGGSELRESFYLDYGSQNDFQNIGRGLQMLSANYFSTSSHYMGEGQYISLSIANEMLKRKSDISLQPASGTKIENVSDPVMVQNFQEQDYYVKEGNKYTLKGVSIAIVLEPRTSTNTLLDTPMSDSAIESYGKDVIKKLYNIIQTHEDLEKIKNVPILMTAYQATDVTTSTVNGHYILQSYCNKEVGEIQKVNHENVLFTSERAEQLDKTTYSEFITIKSNLKNAAIEAAGLVGEARYVNGEIQSMVMTANLNVKTYTELLYLTSIIADGIDVKFSYDFDVKVLVYSQDELKTIITKDRGQKTESRELY